MRAEVPIDCPDHRPTITWECSQGQPLLVELYVEEIPAILPDPNATRDLGLPTTRTEPPHDVFRRAGGRIDELNQQMDAMFQEMIRTRATQAQLLDQITNSMRARPEGPGTYTTMPGNISQGEPQSQEKTATKNARLKAFLRSQAKVVVEDEEEEEEE